MHVTDLILKKRDGDALSTAEIEWLIAAYTAESVPDYQMSAFLMAAFLKGMTDDEMGALTRSMLHSGEVLDLSDIPGLKVDKHSTGGVGDKISIPLAPIVAACGVPVPMISGRGLGHTGGTLDKLESIPGFSTSMDIPAYRRQLAEIGVVMIGQTDDIAPADRKLYALRDVTGTVEFIPFIAASILSKKLAEGIDALVLDVKFGSGAFMQEEAKARELAETMVRLGEQFGKRTVALLTDMNAPLGRGVGNWPEIVESIAILKGQASDDVTGLTERLAAEMVVLGGRAGTLDEALEKVRAVIADGRAFNKFRELVTAQGGDVSAVDHPESRPGSEAVATLTAPEGAGPYLQAIDARTVGRAAVHLGAGRARKEDAVDPVAGFTLRKRVGDRVAAGDILADIHATDPSRVDAAQNLLLEAFTWSPDAPEPTLVVVDRYAYGTWS